MTTINDVKDSVDNIQIGGRNYFAICKSVDGYLTTTGSIHANDTYKEYTSDYIPVNEG